jgi:hypothetical protein
MNVKKAYQATLIFLVLIIVGISYHYINTEQPIESDKNITGPMEPPFNPVDLGIYLGEKTEVGSLTTFKLPVTQNSGSDVLGYGLVYGIKRWGAHDEIFLLDQENRLIPHPLNLKTSTTALELNNVLDSEEISVKGELYNCSAWDGSWFLALKLDNQYIYSVKIDPKPLTAAQVMMYTDSVFYHVNDTAHVKIRNLSEDWLETGRTLWLFKEVNESWTETQPYPNDYLVTNELVFFFPGSSWSHELPLRHLSPGYYKLVKKVSHQDTPEIEVETNFTIIEELVDYSNSTHVFGLESINCTYPTVPDVIPVARKLVIPISSAEAEEIAVNVFGFTQPYTVDGEVNPTIRTDERQLRFSTRYDMLYRGDYPDSFNNWNRTRVIETAENFLDKLEPYWVDSTPTNYSIAQVAPSHISSYSPTTETVREVGVRYQNTLEDIALEGPGADFTINVCRDEVSSCEIRRPVVVVEGYINVTVTPLEAIQLMLHGESATPDLGFEMDQVLPTGSLLTITNVTLVYHTDQQSEWLVPVYVIRGVAHIDPVLYDEDSSDFWWYVYASGFRDSK